MKMSEFEWSIIEGVNMALKDSENYYTDGVVNWNFVDFDVRTVVGPSKSELVEYYSAFNRYANIVIQGTP